MMSGEDDMEAQTTQLRPVEQLDGLDWCRVQMSKSKEEDVDKDLTEATVAGHEHGNLDELFHKDGVIDGGSTMKLPEVPNLPILVKKDENRDDQGTVDVWSMDVQPNAMGEAGISFHGPVPCAAGAIHQGARGAWR